MVKKKERRRGGAKAREFLEPWKKLQLILRAFLKELWLRLRNTGVQFERILLFGENGVFGSYGIPLRFEGKRKHLRTHTHTHYIPHTFSSNCIQILMQSANAMAKKYPISNPLLARNTYPAAENITKEIIIKKIYIAFSSLRGPSPWTPPPSPPWSPPPSPLGLRPPPLGLRPPSPPFVR